MYRLLSKSNYLGRIASHHRPIRHILRDDSSGSNYSTMADSATSGKDDSPRPNPDITGNVKRCLFLSALAPLGISVRSKLCPPPKKGHPLPSSGNHQS